MTRDDGGVGGPRPGRWVESLLPDDLTRRRLRRAILAEAAPVLAVRSRGTWWDVAAGWAPQLIPIAAACALVFAAVAFRAGPAAAPEDRAAAVAGLEDILEVRSEPVLPAVLMQDTVRALEPVLAASLYSERP